MPRRRAKISESVPKSEDSARPASPEIVIPAVKPEDGVDFPFGALAKPESAPNHAENVTDQPGRHPHIRSWCQDHSLGYELLTDARLQVIVLRFDERPTDAVRELVKSKGFRYRDLRDHGRVWVLPNNWEGRTLMMQLDQELLRIRSGEKQQENGIS
ncbi:hypothetical protein [Tuwongella immobilis]|uniref:Uncharacterized protein n=1 Tax=Tuwongella immobilis TaxID=692036 RepID=A0A6C2YVV9_9BACT|nr:hypothetical protein [Tuwongella immobilis]VIP05303.1 unnamed protein product [Tuwongella immobilis]VTS07962.1 unnamed protein product [Tuwongella immobilis]